MMTRLIDADKLADEFYHMPELVYTDAIARHIEMQPAVDAVPVSYIRKGIDEHPTDYTTVESMLTDWREGGDSDEVERC